MDAGELQRCKSEGCLSPAVLLGGGHCEEHRRQNRQGRPSQSDKEPTFSTPQLNPPSGPPRSPTANRRASRTSESCLLNKMPSSGTVSPAKERKQLSEKHTARKSVRQQPNLGQAHTHSASPTSPVRPPSIDTLSPNPRPVKKPRLSGLPSASELKPKTDSSLFSENSIPHPSKRGMFRQSEERTYKLSAVDDFALRPKKKEAADETARSKLYRNQQQLLQSDPIRQTLPSKPPQIAGLRNNVSSTSCVIDLTGDDNPEPVSPRFKPRSKPRSKPQGSPQTHISGGIAVDYQKPQKLSDGNPRLPSERSGFTPPEDTQGRDWQPQLDRVSEAYNTHFVKQDSNPHFQKLSQNTIASSSTVQPIVSKTPISKQVPHLPALKISTEPANQNLSTNSIHPRESHANNVRQISLDAKNAPVTNPASETEQTAKTKSINSITAAQADHIPLALMAIQSKAPQTTVPRQTNGTQPPLRTVELTPVSIDECQLITTSQSPLSALLGGRVWKKMSPEDRRLFWVSQHDPEEFDAQIYSENNRPFRPGDALFGIAVDIIPGRSKRPATGFDYIDPRKHYSHHESEAWYQQKQEEISARGTRKKNSGKAVKQATSKRDRDRDRKHNRSLPQRVRDNPKWLQALEVLERLEAQARERR
ncbi:hypothetical protein F5Y14DRAFT_279307 [Nemania sp. NC0429]|nr:hypothetical protein F5Y14DRAFT_279307 [Nemania sp. NC0429]